MFSLAVGLLIGMTVTPRTTAFDDRVGNGLFAGLKVGQPVAIKDVGAVYEISVIGGEPTGTEVVEVGADYLVLKDVAEVETRIPLTSIKAVVRIAIGR